MSAAQETEIPNGDRLKPVIDAAQSALEFEHARADRLDSKARGQMMLAGSWFAVAQAVAAVALRAPSPPDEGTPPGWVVAIAAFVFLGGAALFLAMRDSAGVWKLRLQCPLGPRHLAAQPGPPPARRT